MVGISHAHVLWNKKYFYLFEKENKQTSFYTKLCYRTGSLFIHGTCVGTIWGIADCVLKKESYYNNEAFLSSLFSSLSHKIYFCSTKIGTFSLIHNLLSESKFYSKTKQEKAFQLATTSFLFDLINGSHFINFTTATVLSFYFLKNKN